MNFKKKLYVCGLLISILGIAISFKAFLQDYKSNMVIKELKIEKDLPVNGDVSLINPPDNDKDLYWEYIKQDFLNINFQELLNTNEETVAWLKVLGTSIDYPIVQATNNTFYLNHSFTKVKSDAGWIFSDFRNNLDYLNNNSIIYGHRRLDNSMFGSMIKVLDDDYFKDSNNHIIKLSTPKTNMLWQVFSVYTIYKENYYITTHFDSNEEYYNFVNTIKNRSIYDFNTLVDEDDKILTLSTCQDNKGMRIVLHAKLIKKETNVT